MNLPATMYGKTCLVTGATRGLGWAAALGLARMGATVVLVGRSQARLSAAVAEIRQATGSDALSSIQAELSSLAEVRRVSAEFHRRFDRLDVLVNNVGANVMRYEQTADGYEMTWALNYLGHFLLSHLLLDLLQCGAESAGEARIVEVCSGMHKFADPTMTRLQTEKGYNGVLAYGQSKRAMLLYTRELARRTEGTGVTINAVSPGFVRTNIANQNGGVWRMMMRVISLFSTPLEAGAQHLVRLAADPAFCGVSGRHFIKSKEAPPDPSLDNPEVTQRLWEMSQHQTGLC